MTDSTNNVPPTALTAIIPAIPAKVTQSMTVSPVQLELTELKDQLRSNLSTMIKTKSCIIPPPPTPLTPLIPLITDQLDLPVQQDLLVQLVPPDLPVLPDLLVLLVLPDLLDLPATLILSNQARTPDL